MNIMLLFYRDKDDGVPDNGYPMAENQVRNLGAVVWNWMEMHPDGKVEIIKA